LDRVSSASPGDPLFWLHHANIDRIWAEWQVAHPGSNPLNKTEVLLPKPLFGVKVSAILKIKTLGYQYA
jgi:tyrosinase